MSTPQSTTFETASGRLTRRAWTVLLVLCGALFLDALDVSMTGVAVPSIQADLHMSIGSLQWVASSYLLGYGGFLLLGGRAADLFGRRRMFLGSLAVFLVASGIGGFAEDGWLLIGARFVTGVAAAFTGPAGLSIITTSFAEGPARNKAIALYTATGASGFSLGLVVGGVLTVASWRWVFFVPVIVALIVLVGAFATVPDGGRPERTSRGFDVVGAVIITTAMLLLVFSLVEAPSAGWGSARTIGSLVGVVVLLGLFALVESRLKAPLMRLGILRSGALLRSNVGAVALQGTWVGCLFIITLYLQDLRGWSSLATGIAVFPTGVIVVLLAPRIAAPLVGRFGVAPVTVAGLLSAVAAYALFLRIGPDSGYFVMLPTFILIGLAFSLAYGPINIGATNGIAAGEQGLAGGIVNMSFQIGPALVLAVVTAVNNAVAGPGTPSPQAQLDGYHAALLVPLVVAALGVVVNAFGLGKRSRPAPAPTESAERATATPEAAEAVAEVPRQG